MKGLLVLLVAATMTALTACESPQEASEAAAQEEREMQDDSQADHSGMEGHAGQSDAEAAAAQATAETNTDLEQAMAVGMMIEDEVVGDGAEAMNGQTVTVHYTGWLYDESKPQKKGDKFDSSHDRNKPFDFQLGAGRVIKGWDLGVVGMKVGGQRTLVIPSELGYGERGTPGGPIPGGATLVFHVELLELQ